jgi:chromosome partitioning protein
MTELGWPDGRTETPDAPVGWPEEPEETPPLSERSDADEVPEETPTRARPVDDRPVTDRPVTDRPMPDYRPIDLAGGFGNDALPSVTLPEPIGRIRAVLQNDTEAPPHTTVTGLDEDTPIGVAAAAAVRVLNPGGRDDFPKPAHRRILTVANQKGGVGKTTTTVNLAAALALHGCQVLVIDLDPQGNASTGMGIEHHAGVPSIYDVLLDDVAIADVVQPAPGLHNLRCVPATIDLAGAEIELVSVVARESRLQRAIAAYCEDAGADIDYVLVDCPPSLGLLTLNAMVATEEVLIPIQCEYYALEGLGQLLKTVDLVRANLNPKLSVSTILLTMYDARTRLADQVVAEVRSHFGDIVLSATIPRSVRVSEAPGYGQSVVTYDPGSRGSIAYLEAAREIATRGAVEKTSA